MTRSIGFLRTATVAACIATASLALPPAAYAFHGGGGGGFHGGGFHGGGFGGGGFHGGGFGGGGFRGGGWGGRGWGGGWGGPGWGVAVVPGWGWGGYGWDDGYYDQYPSCSWRRVAVRTAWGVRWRTIQYC